MRALFAGLTAFGLALGFGPRVIGWLGRRWREPIASGSDRLNVLHRAKQGTPTMGGLGILAAIIGSSLAWANPADPRVALGLALMIGLGALGAVDDLTKLRTGRGLGPAQKLRVQTGLGILAGGLLYASQRGSAPGPALWVPFVARGIHVGLGLIVLTPLAVTTFSNAVNLTDGLDGLAAGCMAMASSVLAIGASIPGRAGLAGSLRAPHLAGGELAVVLGAIAGGVLGFLWFNCHPAQVFMGDTGSLPLGGAIGYAAVATGQELVLLVVGGIFIAEACSVAAQVIYFRLTGNRLFGCAPLHHHFQFLAWHESKIVVRFWIVSALLAVLAVASRELG